MMGRLDGNEVNQVDSCKLGKHYQIIDAIENDTDNGNGMRVYLCTSMQFV